MENALMAAASARLMPATVDATAQTYEAGASAEKYIQWFDDAEDASYEARKASERDRDYKDGKQLTADEIAKLKERGQPDVIINRIASKINYLIGFEARNRTDPKAFPRTEKDEAAGEAATDALRYVEDATDLDRMFSEVWENMMVEGFGGLELTVEEQPDGERVITPQLWYWDRLFFDPHSRKADFSDARYLGGVVWMDHEDAEAMWTSPEQRDVLSRTVTEDTKNTYEDRPHWQKWTSGRGRKRVRIVQMYHREGDRWYLCKFTLGGILEKTEVPFVDDKGRPWCPLIMQSAFVDRENNRYGLCRQMISPQDEINKRRSKALHRTTMRQVIAERGAVDDVDAARRELAKPDGYIEKNPGFEFELLPNGDQLSAELQLLQDAKNDIELIGPNAVMQGQGAETASGKAKQLDSMGGQIEITPLVDRHRGFKKRVYRGIWWLIRMYWDKEKWVRVTDDEKKARFVGFNRPITILDELRQRLAADGATEDQVEQMIAEKVAQDPSIEPMLQQVVRTENVPAEMDMDILIEEVPDVANVQEEQFQALVQLAPAVTFPPQVYLKASSLRSKDELLKILEDAGKNPMQEEIQQTMAEQAFRKVEAEIKKLESEALKNRVAADVALAPAGMIQDPSVMPPPGAAEA